ncbi:hypothetical protein EUX98_g7637, partial [Antrodiella citrinella]
MRWHLCSRSITDEAALDEEVLARLDQNLLAPIPHDEHEHGRTDAEPSKRNPRLAQTDAYAADSVLPAWGPTNAESAADDPPAHVPPFVHPLIEYDTAAKDAAVLHAAADMPPTAPPGDGAGEHAGAGAALRDHQTENHDPIAAVRKDRGEKIFACHVGSCPKLFSSPKGRRLHLIEGHGYPKEYFFAVTNKGVGGLLKKWGEGVSLVRGPWKARDRGEEEYDDEDSHAQEERASGDSGSASGGMDEIADAMNAMTLVPPAIRFGRGGKR